MLHLVPHIPSAVLRWRTCCNNDYDSEGVNAATTFCIQQVCEGKWSLCPESQTCWIKVDVTGTALIWSENSYHWSSFFNPNDKDSMNSAMVAFFLGFWLSIFGHGCAATTFMSQWQVEGMHSLLPGSCMESKYTHKTPFRPCLGQLWSCMHITMFGTIVLMHSYHVM